MQKWAKNVQNGDKRGENALLQLTLSSKTFNMTHEAWAICVNQYSKILHKNLENLNEAF